MADAIQNIELAVDQALAGNSLYTEYQDQWQYLLESFVGGSEYQNAQHLLKYSLETAAEYGTRLKQTPYENHCSSVVELYNSFIFKTPPSRDLGTLAYLPFVEAILEDADHDGRSFNAFMKDVSTYASVFGHTWVVVSKPYTGARTLADEYAMGVRPYLSMLSPLMVLDWSWERSITGRYELTYFKYIEEVNGDDHVIREWTVDTIRTLRVNSKNKTFHSEEEINGLGKIPAVCVYNQRSIIRGIGKSDISDIADQCKYIYNLTSELESSIRLDSHPSLAATPETLLGNGPGSVIQMPSDLDPGLRPYVVQASGANINQILDAINHAIESIDKMASLGSMRENQSRTLSGISRQTEFQMLNAKLSGKADALELAEENIWRLICEYSNVEYDCSIEYADSFNLRDRDADLDFLIKARTSGVTTPGFQEEISRQIIELVVKDEYTTAEIMESMTDEFQPHMMYDPQSGEGVRVTTEAEHLTLQSLGYTHQ